jgi:hypothetical protein
MTVLEQLALALMPTLPALIEDISALFAKYPAMTPAQIAAAVTLSSTQSGAVFQGILAKIAADQAAAKTGA